MDEINCLDLFSGCGGLSRGLSEAGLKVKWGNENDKNAANTYRSAHPGTHLFEEDAKDLFQRIFDKDENVLTDHSKSYLEVISTDYRPQVEVVFAKKRGQERKDNWVINLEEFISVKGINAMGNQLTKEKVLEINSLEPLPYEEPEPPKTEEIEVVDEENVDTAQPKDSSETDSENRKNLDEDGTQGSLFD